MKPHRLVLCLLIALAGCCSVGCISIEQEIFLNTDGSGEMVLHISLPDMPEALSAQPGSDKSPEAMLTDLKKEVTSNLPPTVKVKEVKQVRQNGAFGFYIVLQFKQLDDIKSMLAGFGKESLKDADKDGPRPPEWTIHLNRSNARTHFTQSFLVDLSDKEGKKLVSAETKSEVKTGDGAKAEATVEMKGMEELQALFLSTIKMRFVLHAPAPITDTNADIVMNARTAVWNCSFAAFYKDNRPVKQPIVMKASF